MGPFCKLVLFKLIGSGHIIFDGLIVTTSSNLMLQEGHMSSWSSLTKLILITENNVSPCTFNSTAYTAIMRKILYFLFVVSIAFQGWANARPQESHCMMKEMTMYAQMQNCDDAMPSCCDQHSAKQKSQSTCKHTIDCQSGQLGVLSLVLDKPQLPIEAVFTPAPHPVPFCLDSSNVWRPPQLG